MIERQVEFLVVDTFQLMPEVYQSAEHLVEQVSSEVRAHNWHWNFDLVEVYW